MIRAGLLVLAMSVPALAAAQDYDFLIKGGHVIDVRSGVNGVRDVAVKDGRIAAVAAAIPAARALKTVDASGLYVTPGLVDIHVHSYMGLKINEYNGGDRGVYPDGFTLRSCVTTVADAGSAGWRNFEDFKTRIVDRARTRVLAFINIVGHGMGEGAVEQNRDDMDAEPTAAMAQKYKDVIVGVKSAHYNGADWKPYEQAEIVARRLDIPVMVDFGGNVRAGRTLGELFTKHFRAGDIYTHMYGGVRGEQDPQTGGPSQAMIDGRKRGIFFDVGHGGASYRWATAVPLMKAGFVPDSISTDLHIGSMNTAMKDMLNLMGKFLAMGMPLDEVIRRSTSNPAAEIKRPELGTLAVGSPADIAVLRLETGRFGYIDPVGGRLDATERLECELTVRDGKVLYDLNGIAREPWETLAPGTRGGDPRWDGYARPAAPPAGRSEQRPSGDRR
jgi:dihydroorotase